MRLHLLVFFARRKSNTSFLFSFALFHCCDLDVVVAGHRLLLLTVIICSRHMTSSHVLSFVNNRAAVVFVEDV